MEDEIFVCEEKYLRTTLKEVEDLIEYGNARLKVIPKIYKSDPLMMNNYMEAQTKKLILLDKIKGKPYFARIDFKTAQNNYQCYIGKIGIVDEEQHILTVDWRAPISSLYYDSNVGKCSYSSPDGLVEGNLLTKRQYTIEDGKLLNYRDVDTVSNDEILKPYLNASADSRLKNIVASIQAEQNEIIREDINKNLLIQGVAGSGKTTVALHRVAYLAYKYAKVLDASQYMVIGPNKFFVNYISGVLPDLDVNNVCELTYDELVSNLIKETIKLNGTDTNLKEAIKNPNLMNFEKYKTSINIKIVLDRYLDYLNSTAVPEKNFQIYGYDIVNYKTIKDIYDSLSNEQYDTISKKIDKTIILLENYIHDNRLRIITRLSVQNINKNLSVEETKKENQKIIKIKQKLTGSCKQELKSHFTILNSKVTKLYADFLVNFSRYFLSDIYDYSFSINKTINQLKHKLVDFEDLAILLYLGYKIKGNKDFLKYHSIIIDESQDYGLLHFYVLKLLLPNATFNIFGDLAQSIYSYRSIKDWDEVNSIIPSSLKYLNKSYRTTTEIMNEANRIIKYLNLSPSLPVIRHGNSVRYISYDYSNFDLIQKIIQEYQASSNSSIAIITKTEEEANFIQKKLEVKDLKLINSSESVYDGGLCILPSYLAKGLEFDCVIIADASSNIYSVNSEIDLKLLYVAMTRALHELTILYKNELIEPLRNN